MPVQIGTYDVSSLLAVQNMTLAEFGIETVVAVLQADAAAHNAIITEMVEQIASPKTAQTDVYGTGAVGNMVEVDEYGRAATQKIAPGGNVSYPLRKFQYNIGWTRTFLENATPADLAKGQIAAQIAHAKEIRIQIKKAIFGATNYTYIDHLVNNVSLTIRRFLNADGSPIPDGPDGSVFVPGTHSHYNGSAALNTAAVDAALLDLLEHGYGGRVMIALHHTNAAAFAALTGFVAAVPNYIQTPAFNVSQPSVRTDLGNQYNRLLGYYGAAEVWIKPWGIAGYFFVWDAASPEKPLGYRQRANAAQQGLRIAAEFDSHPLQAQYNEADFGFATANRVNGVVTNFTNAVYATPVITS